MRKAVAVPYVIALILGIAVVALMGIWFATSGGKFGGQSSKTICDNKFLQYCMGAPTGEYAAFKDTNTECANTVGSYARCNQILGTCKRTGEQCTLATAKECCSGTCSSTSNKCT